MPIIESCLSILGATSSVTGIHSWFTGLTTGSEIKTILQDQRIIRSQVERLSDSILYMPSIKQVDTINETSTQVQDLRELRQLLEPVQKTLDEDILSTAIISTPSKLKEAFKKNPWEVLIEVRPAEHSQKPTNPDLVPILFNDNGIFYLGWQTKGALPILFDCHYDPRVPLIRDINTTPLKNDGSKISKLNNTNLIKQKCTKKNKVNSLFEESWSLICIIFKFLVCCLLIFIMLTGLVFSLFIAVDSLAATGETLPEAAKITLKQEKEALEQAEIILQREKMIL